MRPIRVPVLLAVCSVAAGAACMRGVDESEGPRVRLLDTVRLRESDALYVARPVFLVAGPDGSYFVSDLYHNRTMRFSRDGRVTGVYGASGDGPGEFRSVGMPMPIDGATLAVPDERRARLNLYEIPSGAFIAETPFAGITRSFAPRDTIVWVGSADYARGTSLVRLDVRTWEFTQLGSLPPEYIASPALRGIHTAVHVEAWADTLLLGFAGLDRLLLTDLRGRALRHIPIPVRRRRGVPDDVVQALSPDLPFPDLFARISSLFGMQRRDDGSVVLVHADGRIEGRRITDSLFVSVLSPDRGHACVDAYLATGSDAQPMVGFRGDTLLVLDQRIVGQTVALVVRRYTVDTLDCSWIPVAPPRGR